MKEPFNASSSSSSFSPLQPAIKAKGESIFNLMESEGQAIFSMDRFYGAIMQWSMKNEHFKTQMFRFVDVLPYLNSGSEVARHLKEYFAEAGNELPSIFSIGAGIGSLAPGLMAGVMRKNVVQMAKMFITGETPDEALTVLKKQRKNKIGFTVDLLGEACLSDAEALAYQARYLELISWLAKDSQKWDHVAQIDEDNRGPIPRVNVSVKMSSLDARIDLKAWDKSLERVKDRLRPIYRSAMEKGVFLNMDMEQYELKDFTLDIFKSLLLEPEFKNYPHWGIVIQAYLRDSLKDTQDMVAFSKQRGVPFTIRLVKGAYWDFETVHAQQTGWPVPVYTDKRESDANYEACALLMLENEKLIRLAVGSHNVRSVAAVLVHAERLGVDPRAFEIQMLYGMADPIKKSLVRMGYRVREYAPVGEMIPGMAYLVRRLLENTSNESFLRSKFADGMSTDLLLKDPRDGMKNTTSDPYALDTKGLITFKNEPLTDFAIKSDREKMLRALADFKTKELGKDYLLHVGGKDMKTTRWIESLNPSQSTQVIGRVAVAGVEEAEAAMKAAKAAYPGWKKTPPAQRADMLVKLADIFARDRMYLNALEVMEAGKPWEEADGDIAEAIDFCRFYAREMRKLAPGQRVGGVPGELSMFYYQPRGVSVVIAPWNFPLAILAGMVAASLVTGNTVVFKPAEQTPIIGHYLMKALREAGFPAGVANFLNGYGEEIGEYLTGHIDTAIIGFTGSKTVGLHIWKKAADTKPGQTQVKKVICEMGGKNAIIIDSDADLDEAITGVIHSTFGFSGQKCSAASRVIVLDELYDRFVQRLVDATKSVYVAVAEDPEATMGPVIDQEARDRILAMIAEAQRTGGGEGRLAYQGNIPAGGFFVPPTIFVDVKPNAKIAQAEIFGPVLAVMRAKNIDEALEIANSTEYALTGGAYSRSPANIEKIKERFEVGNLYINRGITGAMVDRHPFGGFKMSGAGAKTGGPDYLLNFMEPRVVTENTLRRGFAPAEE
jgi:RHH-type proline utilization regulon transcriptional repressor/proline dehydrogenase/delta 1-pyrroline-5-carboxylate dehydrogenase